MSNFAEFLLSFEDKNSWGFLLDQDGETLLRIEENIKLSIITCDQSHGMPNYNWNHTFGLQKIQKRIFLLSSLDFIIRPFL